ncbi:DUF305 domain-containing protein [Streptomyces sp. t39]|uniref:DUF305 domain-containing protein n=1 Tax=Streptomyces sp. t39 TaxID=1828156 RepID=UPI0011CDA209|nr:DUF305 domain-containing protein [Streptomyces sp. t39]TXS55028.1 DUF305 domain-containing protein [Streptomyces sp. t39]
MTAQRSLARRAAVLAATTAAALALAACGSDGGSPSGHGAHGSPDASASTPATAAGGRHNAADVAFAEGMIPHHRQALEMSELAAGRASSAQVKTLAQEIRAAQDPEIRTLSGWLTSWGEKVPAPGSEGHAGHGAGHTMSGMMSADDMERLRTSSGAAFDAAFLSLMVEHHQGAVEMAEAQKADGSYPPARTMAEEIITAQNAEITRMKALLKD